MNWSTGRFWLKAILLLYVAFLYGRVAASLFFGDAGWLLALLNTFAVYEYLPLILALALALVAFDWAARARRTMLLAGLAGVALFAAQYGRLFLPSLNAAPGLLPNSPLRVMTFNNPFPSFGHADERQAEQILAQQADVILMQELTEAGMQAMARRLAPRYPYIAADRSGLPNEGKLILSRYPLSQSRVIKTGTPGRDAYAALLHWQGREILLVDVHLTATAGVPSWRRAPEVVQTTYQRRHAEVMALLEALANEAHPIILTGDLNTTEQTEVYRLLARHFSDVWVEAGSGFGHSFPAPVFSLASVPLPINLPNWLRAQKMPSGVLRIDYIFHSAPLRAGHAYVSEIGQSDHLAVIAEFSDQ